MITTAPTPDRAIAPPADDHPVNEPLLSVLVHEHDINSRPAFERLWDYYRNELDYTDGDAQRPYRAAQEQGLPQRLTRKPGEAVGRVDVGGGRREIVIENDIAWRIHTLVDFMFGKGVTVQSLAADHDTAMLIERALQGVFDANGGVRFFQDLALLGSVYGFADVLLRVDQLSVTPTASTPDSGPGGRTAGRAPSKPFDAERVIRAADRFVLETVEAPRAIPVLNPADYRNLDAYVLSYCQQLNRVDRASFLSRLVDGSGQARGRLATSDVIEVWTEHDIRVQRDGQWVAQLPNMLGRLPIVHIQNLPQPFFYEGLSEVEALIPLQDELNTRLSDRANRVTFQSFKMYLGKGIEDFIERPVGPGQMWTTDNLEASIDEFGGDRENPSEDAHINEVREALDKTSTVTPVAAGLLGGRVGNLSSEAALRVVLMGLLARTEKKRLTYGRGIEQVCELILHALDVTGVLRTSAADRRVRLHWPSPLPENQTQRLRDARMKLDIGVPRRRVLAELGYALEDTDPAA